MQVICVADFDTHSNPKYTKMAEIKEQQWHLHVAKYIQDLFSVYCSQGQILLVQLLYPSNNDSRNKVLVHYNQKAGTDDIQLAPGK